MLLYYNVNTTYNTTCTSMDFGFLVAINILIKHTHESIQYVDINVGMDYRQIIYDTRHGCAVIIQKKTRLIQYCTVHY